MEIPKDESWNWLLPGRLDPESQYAEDVFQRAGYPTEDAYYTNRWDAMERDQLIDELDHLTKLVDDLEVENVALRMDIHALGEEMERLKQRLTLRNQLNRFLVEATGETVENLVMQFSRSRNPPKP